MQATHDSAGRAVPLTQERKASAKTFAKSDFHDTGSADIWRKYYTQARRATKSTVHGLFVSSLSYACSHGIQSVACWPGRLLHERLLAVACMNGLPQAPAHAVLFGSAVSTLSCCAVAQLRRQHDMPGISVPAQRSIAADFVCRTLPTLCSTCTERTSSPLATSAKPFLK